MKYFWEREIGVRADKIRKNLKEEAVTENYWKENPVLYINKSDYRWGLAYKNLEEVVVIAYNGLTVTLATSKGEKTVTFTDSIKAMLAFYTQDPFVNSGWSEKIKEQIRNREISVGMNEDMLFYSWGYTSNKNKYTNKYGSVEQWIYPNYSSVILENGIITSISN